MPSNRTLLARARPRDGFDVTSGVARDAAEPAEEVQRRSLRREDAADRAQRGVERRLIPQCFVFIRPLDDLGVQLRHALHEIEVVAAEGVAQRSVVKVEDPHHAAGGSQRHAQGRRHVQPFAHDPERPAARGSRNEQGARFLGDATGDSLAEGHSDLRPQLLLEPDGGVHA